MDHDYNNDEESQILYSEKEGDDLFIDLIKSYPHLYNKSSKNYKDIAMKNNSWAEIAPVMNWTVDECQNRWLRLRERFGREQKKILHTRSGMEPQAIPKWPLYEQMKFLEKFISPRKRFSNVTQKDDSGTSGTVEDSRSSDERNDQESENLLVTSHTPDSRPGSSSASETPSTSRCYAPYGKKRKQDAVDASFIELSSALKSHLSGAITSSYKTENDDADDLFCKFIAAELKKKGEICKKKLKKEITTLIFSSD